MKSQSRAVLIIGTITLLGVLFFGLFFVSARSYLRDICNAELRDYAQANGVNMKQSMETALKYIANSGESFVADKEYTKGEAYKTLRIITHNSPFDTMAVFEANGRGINSNGVRVEGKDYPGLDRALLGECSIKAANMDEDAQMEIVIAAPIIKNGKVLGALAGIYETFELSKIINTGSFDGRGYAVLIDAKGNIIVPDSSPYCVNKGEENYWSFFKRVSFGADSSYDRLMADIKERRSGLAVYSFNSQDRELYYTPLGINNWYLLQMVTGDVVSDYIMPMTNKVLGLLLGLGALTALGCYASLRFLRQSAQARMLEAERFSALTENIPGGVAEFKIATDCHLEFANEGFYKIIGYSKAEFAEEPLQGRIFHLSAEKEEDTLLEKLHKQVERDKGVYLEFKIQQKDGTVRWINMNGKIISQQKGGALMQTVVTDITVQKQTTAEILESAKLDKMTRLYDKVSMRDLVTEGLEKAGSTRCDALLVIDIDNFKSVNDTYGHQIGDKAIIMVADTIRNTFRASDLKSRFGGDEFMVLMKDVTDVFHAKQRAEVFLRKIYALELEGEAGRLSCSIGGVVVQLTEPQKFTEVFRQADANLYEVKNTCKGKAIIKPLALNATQQKGDSGNENPEK